MPSEDTQFKSGQVNNPNGRPVGTGFRDVIRKIGALESKSPHPELGKLTKTEAAILASFKLAENGDTNALKFLVQHSEGTKADIMNEATTVTVVYLPRNGRDEIIQGQ
jgi:hypothetical protein